MWLFGGKPARLKEMQQHFDLAALEECRAEGWLTDGALKHVKFEAVDLPGADLRDANLSEASLIEANLADADLSGANLREIDLSGANLSNAKFEGADLTDAIMEEANFTGAQIHEAQFTRIGALWGATMPDGTRYDGRFRLSLDEIAALDENCLPDESEEMAEFYGVSVKEYDAGQAWAEEFLADRKVASDYLLAGPPSTWAARMREEGSLTDGSLRGKDLRSENLMMGDLHDAVLAGAMMIRIKAQLADFTNADLSGADLDEAHLTGAILRGANLRDAKLTMAYLEHADLEGADLTGADLESISLNHAKLNRAHVTFDQLVYAWEMAGAMMPDGLRYDGRFDLEGDLEAAESGGVDIDDPLEMSHWYNVDQDTYMAGQQWAETYLAKLRPEADEE